MSFVHRPDEPGFIVACKKKYAFETWRHEDEVLTYAEALKKAEQLSAEDPEITCWAEHKRDNLANRFYDPEAH